MHTGQSASWGLNQMTVCSAIFSREQLALISKEDEGMGAALQLFPSSVDSLVELSDYEHASKSVTPGGWYIFQLTDGEPFIGLLNRLFLVQSADSFSVVGDLNCWDETVCASAGGIIRIPKARYTPEAFTATSINLTQSLMSTSDLDLTVDGEMCILQPLL